jgi:hypothetical protein
VIDPEARFFGAGLSDEKLDVLVPRGDAIIGEISFEDWLRQSAAAQKKAA